MCPAFHSRERLAQKARASSGFPLPRRSLRVGGSHREEWRLSLDPSTAGSDAARRKLRFGRLASSKSCRFFPVELARDQEIVDPQLLGQMPWRGELPRARGAPIILL
jgi:hypothetical protein